jgi:hypothetical protein
VKIERRADTEGWAGELRVISHAIKGALSAAARPAEQCMWPNRGFQQKADDLMSRMEDPLHGVVRKI